MKKIFNIHKLTYLQSKNLFRRHEKELYQIDEEHYKKQIYF